MTGVDSRTMSAVRLSFSVFNHHSGSARAPISILHGLFGSRLNWASLAGKLARGSGRVVYALDARNHGYSPHVPHMTYELMSRDMTEFLREQGREKSILIGHSMGGKTAMVTALSQPDVVDKLVVADVSPCESPGTGESEELIGVLKQLDLHSLRNRREADVKLSDRIPDDLLRQFLLTNLIADSQTGCYQWRVNLSSIEQSLPQLKRFPSFQTSFTGPTLFIGGANSNYISSASVPEITQLFPQATIRHIPGAGHWLHHDQSEEFLRIVEEFVNS